jgi:hypothetical protein
MKSLGGIGAVQKFNVFAASIGLAVAIVAGTDAAAVSITPPQVVWAERLVAEVAQDRNVYGSHPTIVRWSEDGAGPATNRSVCSSFVTHVFERAYHLNGTVIRRWFGTGNPKAITYAHVIESGRGFEQIRTIAAIRPGDIIAIAYPPGGGPTGHVMVAEGSPTARAGSAPMEPGLRQYELAVIDSSQSGHGFGDTRMRAGAHQTGVGRGTLRLYVAADGMIGGYSWSTREISRFYSPDERRLVVGRFTALPADDASQNRTGGADYATDDGGEAQP